MSTILDLETPEAPPSWASVRRLVLERDNWSCQDCGLHCERGEADVHHLIPRSSGGSDDPSNLITLCDGCHAARHPNLQVTLSRRMIERWAIRLAKFLDRHAELPDDVEGLSAGLRLFGKDRLREGQLDAILAALNGESMIVVRPTGSGKSLCFQLPAMLTEGTTLVISPLKALMRDQVAGLQRLKIPSTFINGDLGPDEKQARYSLLEAGVLKFIYCAPERFNPDMVRSEEISRLSTLRPSFLVVDEAHCVDRWGNDFRPDYGRIGELRRTLGDPPMLAFTATAGQTTQDAILESLGAPDAVRLVTGVDRPNIALVRHQIPGDVRKSSDVALRAELVDTMLKGLQDGKAMIFVPTVKVGDALRAALGVRGRDVPFYHAKLGTPNERDTIVGRFTGRLDPALNIVICTNAFGMGIDVPNVRLVINWQHPASVEDYLQEFGRAGRDGKPALAVVLTEGGREAGLLKFMANKTVVASSLSPRDAEKAVGRKTDEIQKMSDLVTRPAGCFRDALIQELAGSKAPRRSLSRRILETVFVERRRLRKARFCCDACHPDKALAVIAGSLSF
jgi:RecQ family ATP-dependent DNA helicase